MEDIDFKVPVSRDQLYSLVSDMWERVNKPVQMALDTAAMTMDSIDQVNRKQILFKYVLMPREKTNQHRQVLTFSFVCPPPHRQKITTNAMIMRKNHYHFCIYSCTIDTKYNKLNLFCSTCNGVLEKWINYSYTVQPLSLIINPCNKANSN